MDNLNFTKLEVAGNDYVLIDGIINDIDIEEIKKYIKYICNRNYGIGANGVIFLMQSTVAHWKMVMYNKDGTEASMCANGIHAIIRYLHEKNRFYTKNFTIETRHSVHTISLEVEHGELSNITINMGKPHFSTGGIPVLTEKSFFLKEDLCAHGKLFSASCVSIENPHIVIFDKKINSLNLQEFGPYLECHHRFPERMNVSFAEKIDNEKFLLRVWERGSGETLSCGTAACAVTAVAKMLNLTDTNFPICIEQRGGVEWVTYSEEGDILLTGNAKKVYEGKILLKK